MTETEKKPAARAMEPGQGEVLNVAGARYIPKVSGEDTGNAFCSIEAHVPPGAGSPPHICRHEDKFIYVLDGTFRIRLDDESFTTTAGGSAFIPRGVVHNFTNVGDAEGRLLISLTPSGHEKFFAEVSRQGEAGPVGKEQLAVLCERFDMEIVTF